MLAPLPKHPLILLLHILCTNHILRSQFHSHRIEHLPLLAHMVGLLLVKLAGKVLLKITPIMQHVHLLLLLLHVGGTRFAAILALALGRGDLTLLVRRHVVDAVVGADGADAVSDLFDFVVEFFHLFEVADFIIVSLIFEVLAL